MLTRGDATTVWADDALDFFDIVETVARDAGFTFHDPDSLEASAQLPERDPDLDEWGEGEGARREQDATMRWLREQGIAPMQPSAQEDG